MVASSPRKHYPRYRRDTHPLAAKAADPALQSSSSSRPSSTSAYRQLDSVTTQQQQPRTVPSIPSPPRAGSLYIGLKLLQSSSAAYIFRI